MRWYFLLNKNESSLLGKERIMDGTLPICKEGADGKRFAILRYIQAYQLSLSLDDRERCLFEIIMGNTYQKPYFDIDVDLAAPINSHTREQRVRIGTELPKTIKTIVLKEFPQIRDEDVLVFESNRNSPNKISYHIIVTGWCVHGSKANRRFFERIMKDVPEPWKVYVDHSMYKTVQYFRIYMSTKFGKDRIKDFDSKESTWTPTGDGDPVMELFMASLVSYTKDCSILPIDVDEDEVAYDAVELCGEDENEIRRIVKAIPDSNCFQIQGFKDGGCSLKRLAPSYCRTCERVHDNENPYVYVTNSGYVMFTCRRSDKSSVIGRLWEQTTEVKPKTAASSGFYDVPSPQILSSKTTSSPRSSAVTMSPTVTVTPPPPKPDASWRVQRRRQMNMNDRLSSMTGYGDA
jgi:hypothetical protein